MNIPRDDLGDELRESIEKMRRSAPVAFERFCKWIKTERDARDKENRFPGNENKTSEAMALSTLLEALEGDKSANE